MTGQGWVSGAITNALEGGEDTDGKTIVGGEHTINALVGVVGAQEVFHAGLSNSAVPAKGTDYVHAHLTTGDNDRAGVDEGLDNGHSAIIEVEGIGVVGGATEEFNVERTNASRGCFTGGESESIEELGSRITADAEVIECSIVINIFGLGD